MREKLTSKQKTVYEFLKRQIKESGYPPTVREVCDAVNLSSTSSAHAHIESLERKGYIHRSKFKNRCIEILEDDFYRGPVDVYNAPILGRVTAGQPILAVEDCDGYFPVPVDYVGNHEAYMLRIKGDSMIEKGILDGDLVLVKKQTTAVNGEVVVALIDDSATVKTFYKERLNFRLQPENAKYEPIILRDVTILGVVIGLFRSFKS